MANTFKYYGAHIWNLVPNAISKNSTTINNFKLSLKVW